MIFQTFRIRVIQNVRLLKAAKVSTFKYKRRPRLKESSNRSTTSFARRILSKTDTLCLPVGLLFSNTCTSGVEACDVLVFLSRISVRGKIRSHVVICTASGMSRARVALHRMMHALCGDVPVMFCLLVRGRSPGTFPSIVTCP